MATLAQDAHAFRTAPDSDYADLMNGRITVAQLVARNQSRRRRASAPVDAYMTAPVVRLTRTEAARAHIPATAHLASVIARLRRGMLTLEGLEDLDMETEQ